MPLEQLVLERVRRPAYHEAMQRPAKIHLQELAEDGSSSTKETVGVGVRDRRNMLGQDVAQCRYLLRSFTGNIGHADQATYNLVERDGDSVPRTQLSRGTAYSGLDVLASPALYSICSIQRHC